MNNDYTVPVCDELKEKVPARCYLVPKKTKVMPVDEKFIDRVFVRFNSIYGHLWSSRYQTGDMLKAAKAEWAYDLGGFSYDQISRGITECKRVYKKPPTLPEFVEIIKIIKQVDRQDFLRLPVKKSSAETAAPFREQLKTMLR